MMTDERKELYKHTDTAKHLQHKGKYKEEVYCVCSPGYKAKVDQMLDYMRYWRQTSKDTWYLTEQTRWGIEFLVDPHAVNDLVVAL